MLCPLCGQSFIKLAIILYCVYLGMGSLAITLTVHSLYANVTQYISFLILSYFLISLALIDYYYRYLPDTLTLPLIWLGLVVNLYPPSSYSSITLAILGAIAGYLSLKLINLLFYLVRKKHGLGGGDIKLFAALGAWFGLNSLPYLLFIACLLGLGAALISSLYQHKKINSIAFGPYLGLAAIGYYLAHFA
ncbi:prepilin peptidase [Piscirickettsia litoralis]|uniref:prepilin peptidase n=1 Tax=Piscirickettsia litoralis TaxID=1891921 RepID=UPI000A7BFB24|nr:A24 family peptidase [Piscirickettsia litoralis]